MVTKQTFQEYFVSIYHLMDRHPWRLGSAKSASNYNRNKLPSHTPLTILTLTLTWKGHFLGVRGCLSLFITFHAFLDRWRKIIQLVMILATNSILAKNEE